MNHASLHAGIFHTFLAINNQIKWSKQYKNMFTPLLLLKDFLHFYFDFGNILVVGSVRVTLSVFHCLTFCKDAMMGKTSF